MRSPILLFAILAGSGLYLSAAIADDTKPQDAKVHFQQFDGTWKVVGLEANGVKAPADALKGMRWSFNGTEVEFADPGEKPANKTGLKGKTIQGIFKFEKDRLIICLRDPEAANEGRPKEFKTEAESGLGMITLERVK
jgi:hypothetical protein